MSNITKNGLLGVLLIGGIWVMFGGNSDGADVNIDATPTQNPIINTNPNYQDLTEDQIKIADAAIGEFLNSGRGARPSDVTVLSVTNETYPDASLGCPVDGESYAQVETAGHNVLLIVGQQLFEYHINTSLDNAIECIAQ